MNILKMFKIKVEFIQIFLLRINTGSGHTAATWKPEGLLCIVLTHPTCSALCPRLRKE